MSDRKVWKVYRDADGPMVAACAYAEDAAAVVGMSQGVVRVDGRIVFRQSSEVGNPADDVDAADSWDGAAKLMHERRATNAFAAYERSLGYRHPADPRGPLRADLEQDC